MLDTNEVKLTGNLGRDPEVLKRTDTGCFVRLSVGTNKKYKNAQKEIVKDTQWHTVYLNNWLGDKAASHLKTGSRVVISGELQTKQWEDEKTGETRYSVGIYAKTFEVVAKLSKENDVSTPDKTDVEGNADLNILLEQVRGLLSKKRK